MMFMHELRRRKVVRVAAVYAATAFVLLQAADLILPALALPDWTYRLLVLLALFGLPIALVLGWAFELTPDGVRATTRAPAAAGEPPPSLVGRRTIVATALLLALAVGLGAGLFVAPTAKGTSAGGEAGGIVAERSVAVLPFADFSASADQEWFSDGLTEEILNALARLPDLRVASRTGSFRFKGSDLPVRDIAAQLEMVGFLIDVNNFYAWDVLAAMTLVDSTVVRLRPAAIAIRLDPPEDGRSAVVADRAANVQMAYDADEPRFRELLVSTLTGSRLREREP